MSAADSHPGRTLRVGVTGARALDPGQQERLQKQVTALLHAIAARAGAEGAVTLELLSPLAEGADRLVARCALTLDSQPRYTLFCPMPFRREDYQDDFTDTPGSLDDFNAILEEARPRILELDGKRSLARTHADGSPFTPQEQTRADRGEQARAYEAVGRLIVRNCDLLIAVWDGLPGQGPGGTADTLRYAANFGPPVVWIHATDANAPPRWIEETHDLRHGAAALPVDDRLKRYLRHLLAEPKPHRHPKHQSLMHAGCHHVLGAIGAVGRFVLRRPAPTPLRVFLKERPHKVWGPWKMIGWFTAVMTWCRISPPRYYQRPETGAVPRRPEAEHWHARFAGPDERANEYVARYRSSYVWAFLLAAMALSAAAFSLAFPDPILVKTIATGVELATLLLILLLVVANSLFGWQTRAIEYRLVAELCRKQQALAPLGWVVPRTAAWATGSEPAVEHAKDKPDIEPIPWVSWLFSAWVRDAGLPSGTIDSGWIEATRKAAIHDLIEEQIAYHDRRCIRSYRAGKRLVRLGELVFVVVLVLVAVKFRWLWQMVSGQQPVTHDTLMVFGLLGAILPTSSAALVGIRAYAELEMLAEQSAAMLKAMRDAKAQIVEIDPAAPLASQTLGVALAGVATLMLEDLEGWAMLFRGKVLDA